jgi:polysaccharide biosynthesis protein PslG
MSLVPGVCAHSCPDDGLELLAAAGIRLFRIDMNWTDIERQRGHFDWRVPDTVIACCERLGVQILACLAYTPAWASGVSNDPQGAAPPTDYGYYIDFINACVERYRNRVTTWSVWNEPNLKQFWGGSRQQFEGLFAAGVTQLRGFGLEVAGPDITGSKAWRDWGPMLMEAGAKSGGLAAITHHQYDGGDKPEGRMRELDQVRAAIERLGCGHIPFWLTEIGWDRVTQEQQAAYLTQTWNGLLQRPWVNAVYWYDSHGAKWGLLTTDTEQSPRTPKQSYYAYKDVIAANAV